MATAPTPSPTGSSHVGPPGPGRTDADLPADLRAWIDAHDPAEADVREPDHPGDVRASGDASDAAGDRLAAQRAEHEPDRTADADADADECSGVNEVLGELVNNTGDDGGAASG
ncbi:MAG: hypothetical protein KDB40_04165 [Acidimicrobiales bacterium]|nr:hypothetical protein [Acidimicrobiales bacterium]MCB9393577.1 hypothetical protein [Acidimicrobiaceae bacterium]